MAAKTRHSNQASLWIWSRLGLLVCALQANMAWAQTDPTEQVAQGFSLMRDRSSGNCLACHALPGQTGTLSNFGPALDQVALRYTALQLRQWVSDARVIKPDTLMPPFGSILATHLASPSQPILNGKQIEQVVAALLTLR